MKPFNLELAKAGHPVCTRNGLKARIICFDRKDSNCPIIALISDGCIETTSSYTTTGHYSKGQESQLDLMMVQEKKEGWINIYKTQDDSIPYSGTKIHKTKKDAQAWDNGYQIIDTIKIEWEE